MPQYTWKGIDLAGNQKHGTYTADSPAHLKEQLLLTGIALLSYTEQTTRWPRIIGRCHSNTTALVTFFEYLHHLLDSGIPLLTALELVAPQLNDQQVSIVIKQIMMQVKKGEAFSTALQKYPTIFPPLAIQLIMSGEKTGKLAPALVYLCTYLKEQNSFKKTLMQAAIFPLFTITLALIITAGILLFIIPQFEQFFSSMNKVLPPLTQGILTLSAWLRSWYSLLFFLAIILVMFLVKTLIPKNITACIGIHIPFLGNIIVATHLITTLRMLSLFLKAGIPLKQALEIIASSIKNQHFAQKLHIITHAIVAGQNLAMQLPKFAPTKDAEILTTFITLGEQTGKLDTMLDKAIVIFEENLKKRFNLFSLFFQPTLMIIVGLTIALLMAAVYLPLFNLAYSVS